MRKMENQPEPSQPEKFKDTLMGLVCDVEDIANDSGKNLDLSFLAFAKEGVDLMQSIVLLEGFVKGSYSFWDKIADHIELFFMNNVDTLLQGAPEYVLNSFKKVLTDPEIMSKDDKNCIWSTIEALARISIVHIHNERFPTITPDGKKVYKHEYLLKPVDKLGYWAKRFGLKLEWE